MIMTIKKKKFPKKISKKKNKVLENKKHNNLLIDFIKGGGPSNKKEKKKITIDRNKTAKEKRKNYDSCKKWYRITDYKTKLYCLIKDG